MILIAKRLTSTVRSDKVWFIAIFNSWSWARSSDKGYDIVKKPWGFDGAAGKRDSCHDGIDVYLLYKLNDNANAEIFEKQVITHNNREDNEILWMCEFAELGTPINWRTYCPETCQWHQEQVL
jgi:hypothetical protein